MTTPIYIVYKITNIINNKIYIGKHSTINLNDSYMGSGDAIKLAIKKYGRDNFTKEILFEYDNERDAYSKEHDLVDLNFIKRLDTYNKIEGGNGWAFGRKHTTYSKEKISKSHKGRKHTIQSKKNMSIGRKNIILSKTHKQNISNSMKNRKFSDEHKNKISKSKTGILFSDEHKKNLSLCKTGTRNYQFVGWWIVPWGKFESSKKSATKLISYATIRKWCKKPNIIIDHNTIIRSKYLQSLKESPLDKTFKEIGFDFQSI